MNQPRKLNTGAAYGEGQTPVAGAPTQAQPARPAQTTYTGRARSTYGNPGQVARPASRYQGQGQNAQPYRDPYQAQYNQSPSPYQYTPTEPPRQPQPPADPYAAEVQAQQARIRTRQQAEAEAQAAQTERQNPSAQPVQRAQRPYQNEVPRPAGAKQSGYNTTALEREQIEAARRRAQELANQNARRRVVQQPVRSAQLSRAEQEAAAEAAAAARAAEAQRRAEAAAAEEAANRQLTRAQQQALAYRQAAERKYGDTASFNPPRTVREEQQEQMARRVAAQKRQSGAMAGAQISELDVRKAQPSKPAYNYSDDPAYRAGMAAGAEGESAQFVVPGTQGAPAVPNGAGGAGGAGGKPPRGGNGGGKPPKGSKPSKDEKPKKGKKEKKPKKKSKFGWLRVLLITLLIIALILFGAYALILNAIAPNSGGISLNQLLNTPKEFQDDEFNFVMIGIDRSTSGNLEAGAANDAEVNDGNTDMILYVHYNNVTGEMKMLQIPRDTLVTTDRSFSANYRINNIAMTQAATSNSLNVPALCEQIATMYQVPVDGYMTIRLEMLVELVDLFGGIELYVPTTMDYAGSHLDEGYQTLNGAACEFLLRTRHIYPDGDIGRLNMQRQFYSALFRKLKSIGNIWDVAKLTPAVLNYMETDINASKLVSFAVSMLKIDSSKIMICQMPVKMGQKFNEEAVVYPARQEDADLLNQYFRENTGPVDAAALKLVDGVDQLGFDISGLAVTDANVQFMGALNEQAAQAQQTENLDGSNTVVYVDPTPAPEGTSTEGDSAAEDAASEPAA